MCIYNIKSSKFSARLEYNQIDLLYTTRIASTTKFFEFFSSGK